MSAESADTCVVNRIFDHAAPDHVMHIKVTGSYGDCICSADELVIQLNRIGEYWVVYVHLQSLQSFMAIVSIWHYWT